jgi:hypothetical protein
MKRADLKVLSRESTPTESRDDQRASTVYAGFVRHLTGEIFASVFGLQ